MATIQELSKRCGVSVSTVSKALNGYTDISDRTRELVINTAKDMGYLPNSSGKAPRPKKTYNIGIVFHTVTKLGLRNEYFAHILEAFKEEAAQRGYHITFIENYLGKRRMTFLEQCQHRQYDGVFIVCADFESEEIARLVNSDIPVATIDYSFQKAYSIISDNYGGMKQLTNYIIHQGHKDIAFIHGRKASLVTQNRMDSFYDTMAEHGLSVPEEYVVESQYRNVVMAEQKTLELLQLPKKPTCILAPDDLSALGVMSAIRKKGLQPVKNISVAGFDGVNTNILMGARLTTVKQERDLIGKEAADHLIKLIEGEEKVPLATIFMKQSLLIGNSVRRMI